MADARGDEDGMLGVGGPKAALGVASWSLRPESPRELVERVRACGLAAVQLALDPIRTGLWDAHETRSVLTEAGIRLVSGMMATKGEDYSTLESIRRTGGVMPDEHWPANAAAAAANAQLARFFGLDLVTLHAGFIPEDEDSPERAVVLDRLVHVARVFAEAGVEVALETGQESPAALASCLERIEQMGWRVGVNFDPANMILYGSGEPIDAVRTLGGWVSQVHMKDALPSEEAGEWGLETPVGLGAVDWPVFFGVCGEVCPDAGWVIERESGEARVADIRRAAELVSALMGRAV